MATTSVRPRSSERGAGPRRSGNGRRAQPDRRPTKQATKPAPSEPRRPRAANRPGGPKEAREPKGATQASRAAKAAREVAGPAAKLAEALSSHHLGLTRGVAAKAAGIIARRAVSSGTESLRDAVQRVLESSSTAVDVAARRRPPIQRSIDAAVPVQVAWEEWMTLAWLPEGVARIRDIVREGDDGLTGKKSQGARWSAEILDERHRQSFAWRSHQGTDCAGLVTFHDLSERLTRIELSLDVVPINLEQAAVLSTRLADRRTDADLRRFKARLELINPDLYEDG